MAEPGSGPLPVERLVDVDRLTEWARGRLPGAGRLDVVRLGEGHSNLTFSVRRPDGAGEWVLRRPPLGPLLPTAHDVVREYRVLSLLGAAGDVRVPAVTAVCEDETVIGAPFYLMAAVAGVVIRDRLPAWLADDDRDRDARHGLGCDVVEALAELHTAPYQPLVDAGIGRPGGYLARQLRRWRGQREGIQQAVAAGGGTARELPDYDAVRDWLDAHLPEEAAPAVVHGDYKLDNVIVAGGGVVVAGGGVVGAGGGVVGAGGGVVGAGGGAIVTGGPGSAPRVNAIVDWEMATVGDPRADLGYLLSFWPEPGESLPGQEAAIPAAPGFPDRAALVDRWAQRTGRDPGDPRWFITLAVWKLAILLEASYHRWLAGMADDPFFATLDEGVPALLRRAREVCGA